MSLGVRYDVGQINAGDTAELYAALREREGVIPADEIVNVEYTVQKPNGEIVGPISGSIEEDGQGYYQWTETGEAGPYLAQAQFTLLTGEKRSVMVNFVVENPFDQDPTSPQYIVAEEVWIRLEDAFDSVEGGPAIRDWTLAHFDQAKIARFIPEVLLDINVQMHPTNAQLTDFLEEGGEPGIRPYLPILAKGVLCKVIMHLIRSYVEQPIPQGGQIVYEDRTRYAAAWKEVYQDEHKDYMDMVRLWKRGFLNLGKSASLISSKAGRLYFAGGVMRTRNVGRGFF